MSDQDLYFSDTSRPGLINYFEHDPNGRQISNYVFDHFAGPAQVINHIQPAPEGSVLHFFTGDNFVFHDVPRPRLASVVRAVTGYFARGGG